MSYLQTEILNELKANMPELDEDKARTILDKFFRTRAVVSWEAADIDSVLDAREETTGIRLNSGDYETILDMLESKHDADMGISWETVRCAVDELCRIPGIGDLQDDLTYYCEEKGIAEVPELTQEDYVFIINFMNTKKQIIEQDDTDEWEAFDAYIKRREEQQCKHLKLV